MKILNCIIRKVALGALVMTGFCGTLSAGAGPAAYLNQGIGARAMGMGGAFTAVADDASAAYWNPAGLALIDNIQGTLIFQRLSEADWPGLEDIAPSFSFFNFVLPMSRTGLLNAGVASLSIATFGIDNIPLTQMDASGNLSRGSFTDKESAIIFSAGYPILGDDMLIGLSIRYLSLDFDGVDGASASGWDMQIGQMFHLNQYINLGFTLQRGPTMVWESGYKDTGDIRARLGLAYEREFGYQFDLTSSLDLIQQKDMPLQASLGAELGFNPHIRNVKKLFARLGVKELTLEDRHGYRARLNNTLGLSGGFGARVAHLNYHLDIDYAIVNSPMGSDHLVTIGLGF
ncbi:MAG: hypothetical protein GX817_01875 [Elusimicrobia bacterium]|nr:hypothetical protein [Elusimicrobiota bacterium]